MVEYLPILIFVIFFIATRSIKISLFTAILSSILSFQDYLLMQRIERLFNIALQTLTSANNFYSLLFLFFLFWTIAMAMASGITESYKALVNKFFVTKKSVEYGLIGSSLFLSIDDYFSSLCAKAFFQPLLSAYGIAREKYVYLMIATGATSACLSPISSWTCMLMSQYFVVNTQGKFTDFIAVVPFFYYAFNSIITALYITITQTSFGHMKKMEIQAKQNMLPIKKQQPVFLSDIIIFILPFFIMIMNVLLPIFSQKLAHPEIAVSCIIDSIPIMELMAHGVMKGICIVIFFYIFFKGWTINIFKKTFKEAFYEAYPTCSLLALAWVFAKVLLNLIDITSITIFLASVPFINFIIAPFLMILATLITMSIGTTWGTIALLAPLAGIASSSFLVNLCFGAIVSGAIAGNNLSFFGDSIVINAAAVNLAGISHVRMCIMPYIIVSFIATLFSYVFSSFLVIYGIKNIVMHIVSMLGIYIITMVIIQWYFKNKK